MTGHSSINSFYNGSDFFISRAPLRISFFGGGTDMKEFYHLDHGAVLSTTINKYLYVTVKRHGSIFNEPIRLNYSETELVDKIDDIRNEIARECMRFLNIESPIYISTVADVPSASGLGSSSSFAVGLLLALHALKGERISKGQIANEACHIEIEVLKKPIGKQDQYASSFGGLNFLRFNADERVFVEPQIPSNHTLKSLFDNLMMFWTGISRQSSSILKEQKDNTMNNHKNLIEMRNHAEIFRDMLGKDNFVPEEMGILMNNAWKLKRQLASKISGEKIDHLYAKSMAAGAYGGKVAGAGGGGFLLLVVPPKRQKAVREVLSELMEIEIQFEAHGARLLFPHF